MFLFTRRSFVMLVCLLVMPERIVPGYGWSELRIQHKIEMLTLLADRFRSRSSPSRRVVGRR